jgi:alginate O-acetyltransferase complex protein AlgI
MQLGIYLRGMAGLNGAPLLNSQAVFYLRGFLPVLILAGIFSTPLPEKIWKRINSKILHFLILIFAMVLCTAYVVAGTYNPFLYFRF